MKPIFLVLLASTLLATGCKKNPCPEGAYTNAAYKVCLKLPEGMVFDKEEDQPNMKSLQFVTKDKGSPRMSLQIYKSAETSYASEKAFIEGMVKSAPAQGNTVAASGQPEGGEGTFALINYKNGVISQLNYVLKSNNQAVECYTNTGTPSGPAILDSCKTLRILP